MPMRSVLCAKAEVATASERATAASVQTGDDHIVTPGSPGQPSIEEIRARFRPALETLVRKFFERYERCFNRALGGALDVADVAALYASEFIAASPAGVLAGKNDDQLKQVLAQGYERYRAIGTKEMRIRDVRLSSIDDYHCVAHVAWTATYARKHQPDTAIDFDVHYFVQTLDGKPKVFGWVSGDEQALLRKHGII